MDGYIFVRRTDLQPFLLVYTHCAGAAAPEGGAPASQDSGELPPPATRSTDGAARACTGGKRWCQRRGPAAVNPHERLLFPHCEGGQFCMSRSQLLSHPTPFLPSHFSPRGGVQLRFLFYFYFYPLNGPFQVWGSRDSVQDGRSVGFDCAPIKPTRSCHWLGTTRLHACLLVSRRGSEGDAVRVLCSFFFSSPPDISAGRA